MVEYTPEQAFGALLAIPPTIAHDTRARVGMAAKDAGISLDDYDAWQSANPRYNAGEVRSMWHSFTDGPVKAGTLFSIAREHGWAPNGRASPFEAHSKPARTAKPQRKPAPGMAAADVWERCQPATNNHPYMVQKGAAGVPLQALRVVPEGDPLRIMGESMAGALVVPCMAADGTLSTLQLIPPPEVVARLKAADKPGKLNLPGHSVQGWFTVGELVPGGLAYIVEGIGQAWAVWQATGAAAVVAFGAGNMGKVATALRQSDDAARLVLCPDRGKEPEAHKIAADIGAAVACLPESEPDNFDVGDLFQRDGFDVLAALLESATMPPKPEPRYKLLNRDDLAALPALSWRVRCVLPAVGLAGLYGPSASGKSFLAFDLGAAIADGERWFGCRVEAAPVVYAALEGEAGFKLRAQAWEAHTGRLLPDGLHMVLQPFSLTDPRDVSDLAAVVPAGGVVFIDTLNRAAPTADENSSSDMGEILQAAKRLQALTAGLVVLVHHTGKDATKGLRGHSSLFAAMDAAIEVSRDGDRREWRCAKSKDGADGDAHPFKLEVKTLGTDGYGDPITSCVVRTDTTTADVRAVKLPQGGNQRLVYEGIRTLFKDGHTGKPGAPPLRPCIELEAAVLAGAARLTCPTNRRATRTREAITGLVSRGVLGLNEGWLWTV